MDVADRMRALQWRRLQWWQMTWMAATAILAIGLGLVLVAFLLSVWPGVTGSVSGWLALSAAPLLVVMLIGVYSQLQDRADVTHGRTEADQDPPA